LAEQLPWEKIEEEYLRNFEGNEGQVAKTARLAFGALYIQMAEGLTDAQTCRHIQENPYFQYFCGFERYSIELPFHASMMTLFRKRISAEMIQRITLSAFAECAQEEADNPESVPEEDSTENADDIHAEPPAGQPKYKGTLILDATCCPADIAYPTDIGLLNHARELTEEITDELYKSVQELFEYKPRTYRNKARKEYLAYTKKRRHTDRETRNAVRGQLQYVERNLRSIEALVEKGAPLTLLNRVLFQKLLVIQELVRQQRIMYDEKTHRIDGRIVSIPQPHIRPIVRGKTHEPTEFGAKVAIGLVGGYAFLTCAAWENYPESSTLKDAVEQYRMALGTYPKTLIADRVYPTKENREWCKERGIRLSGPRLGRKSEQMIAEEQKQIYEDSCERNAVEGEFGTVKRRYGLDRIMAKLPDTSLSSIAMGFFVANMERRLRLIFVPDGHWVVDYDFDVCSLVILPRNSVA
jgi:IS5 family transposase